MSDIPDTNTFKPDYLCDPPCSYHTALQEQLEMIVKLADEVARLRAENERLKYVVRHVRDTAAYAWHETQQMARVLLGELERTRHEH